jgi:D-alanine-D-alanine ligase-like ATP-grasp enzyme
MARRTAKQRIRSERLTVGSILKKAARDVGVTVNLEPEWKIAGQIVTPDGRKRYFRSMSLDLNTQGAAALASDKDYATFFLRKMGHRVVDGKAFYSDEWCRQIVSDRNTHHAILYAKKIQFPVIVKPNSASQGKGVILAHTEKELRKALRHIFTFDRVALVQRHVVGRDYRIVVLDGAIISAYERIPLSVTGDGHSTITQLLQKKQRAFQNIGRDTKINAKDPRISAKISEQHLTLRTVLEKGRRIELLYNANLSTGGDAVDVTNTLHPAWKKLAAQIAQDMNLRFTGIDVMLPGDLSESPKEYRILEVNDSPGLDHYATIGPAQKKIVETLYRKVLRAMSKKHWADH